MFSYKSVLGIGFFVLLIITCSYTENTLVQVTFFLHVTVSFYGLPRYDRVKPIITADCLSSFTRLDFLARFSGQLSNGTKGY